MNDVDIKTEIEALIEEANADLEMVVLAYDKNDVLVVEAKTGCEIYVQALKDLAERLGVKLG